MPSARLPALALCLMACACATSVSTTPAGKLSAPPRAAGCQVEFFRSKVPDRPYDELAGLHAEGGRSATQVQEAMRARACEVGADAVIITRDYVPAAPNIPAIMTGTAVKYRESAAERPQPAKP